MGPGGEGTKQDEIWLFDIWDRKQGGWLKVQKLIDKMDEDTERGSH